MMMKKTTMHLTLMTIAVSLSMLIYAQEIMLWPDLNVSAPLSAEKIRMAPSGDHVISNIHFPSIKPYLPAAAKATGAAVIIAPGGGHRELWIDHEGYNVAAWLADQGIAAFVLKYRLARDSASTYSVDGEEVSDMLQAIRLVRSRCAEWHILSDRIGVMGFSAGGEVAGLASIRFSLDKSGVMVSDKPDFQALIYPGGVDRLDAIDGAPPNFLLGGYADRDDISRGIAELYLKCKSKKIPAELHIYAKAGHGFGVKSSTSGSVKTWQYRFYDWMADLGFLNKI